jgi:hypothetical protein
MGIFIKIYDFIAKILFLKSKEPHFNCMMLSRLESDVLYYLGCGNRNPRHLWALDEVKHIKEMKRLYNSFPITAKPQWINMSKILEYQKLMS